MFGFNNSLTPYGRNPHQSLFENFFEEPFPSFGFGNEMKTDIRESEDAYSVKVDLPGAAKENIALNYDRNEVLSVSVHQSSEKNTDKSGYIRRERYEGTCRRDFYLPGVDAANISAKYENGILNIELPKSKARKDGHSIDIQ